MGDSSILFKGNVVPLGPLLYFLPIKGEILMSTLQFGVFFLISACSVRIYAHSCRVDIKGRANICPSLRRENTRGTTIGCSTEGASLLGTKGSWNQGSLKRERSKENRRFALEDPV